MITNTSAPSSSTTLQRGIKRIASFAFIIAMMVPSTSSAAAPSSPIPYEKALSDAKKVTALHGGWKVYEVHGQSMNPEFGESSLLLASQAYFSDLAAGMVVIYRDDSGDLVAHRLVELHNGCWVAKGLSNTRTDPGMVTQVNYIGVVFGVMNYKAGSDKIATIAATERPQIALAKKY